MRNNRGGRYFRLKERPAKALQALMLAGDFGVSSTEAASWAGLRFAEFFRTLRTLHHRHGIDITTTKEKREGRCQFRYVLVSDIVQVMSLTDQAGTA